MAATKQRILLKQGTLLVNEDGNVTPRVSDLLIVGDRISEIRNNIEIMDEVKVIDCKDKIVTPGFISTHNHI
jgi:imidazolonepropionase-like amidohydrolase